MPNNEFLWRKDFKNIIWKETLWLNFLRALFAGPVWMIFMLATGEPFSIAGLYLLFPLMYFIAAIPLGLIASFLAGLGVPFAGLFAIMFSLLVVVGDPFVFIIKKIKPELIPVENFGLLNFSLIIFSLDRLAVQNVEAPVHEDTI